MSAVKLQGPYFDRVTQQRLSLLGVLQRFAHVHDEFVGRDSSVGTATRYGLDGPWIEFRWGRDFPNPSRPALGSAQLPIHWVPGVKRRGEGGGFDHPPSSNAGVKEIELLPSRSSWPVLG
jgi:hypothetical protein